jgi:hypothetical protein
MTGMVLAASPVFGSGDPGPFPLFISSRGGSPAELERLFAGRLGIVTARSPEPLLYLDWRLLHGLEVGPVAGAALTTPCCDERQSFGPHEGVNGWLEARALVPGVAESPYYLPTERPGPDYTSVANCFRDAFETATATLRDRAARYGRRSPAVRAWLQTQDAVFDSCASESAALPPIGADSPAWLKADRAYQEAAFELYNGRNGEAASRFEAIARDAGSPWRSKGMYLHARALQREALASPDSATIARSRAALHELAAAPAGTYGQAEVRKMLRALDYRDRPDRLLAELDSELGRREPSADIAYAFRDYLSLGDKTAAKREVADWIETLAGPDTGPELDHARERWSATRDPAWLVAALTLVGPTDPGAPALAADAAAVKRGDPAWLTAQYHLTRLTIESADPAATRAKLDSILADPLLTLTERNLFFAARAQVASDLDELARFSLRRAFCGGPAETCTGDEWAKADDQLAAYAGGWVGLGADARAILDRLPLDSRIAFSRSPLLPAELRLDIALTGFARAVQLQDERAVDGTARDLARLLPQMRREWRAIVAARPGEAKRFAEYFAMAKLPGLRTDLIAFRYTRPQGTVRQFQGRWEDWAIIPRGAGSARGEFPGAQLYEGVWYGETDVPGDLTCLRECGRGAFPLHLPRFVQALQDQAAGEQASFVAFEGDKALPAGSLSAWDEALAYARAHPRDPRSPEALYWLIHVARWGANHDHLGRRAFQLLHARYPGSAWARRSPYYYDD